MMQEFGTQRIKANSNNQFIFEITDFNCAYKKVEELAGGFVDTLVNFTLSASLKNFKFNDKHSAFELRDSIIYRLNAVKFHIAQLFNHQAVSTKRIIDLFTNQKPNAVPMEIIYPQFVEQGNYLLDSIVFHLATAFDYLSNYLEYLLGSKRSTQMKWGSLIKALRDKGNNKSQFACANDIIQHNIEFVDKLFDYRSRVIHDKEYMGGHILSIGVIDPYNQTNFYILANNTLLKKFSSLDTERNGDLLSINYAAVWLFRESISRMEAIILLTRQDLEKGRIVKKEDEWLKYWDEENKIMRNIDDKIFPKEEK